MYRPEDSKLGAAAFWEAKTDSKIKQNAVQSRFEALKARREAGLDARRDKLAQKLHAEEQQLKQELVNSQESPAQRRAAMAARAREMARRREAERQQLADELMEQAFRDNCDPLRERYSRQIIYKTAQEREQQIQEKMALRILEEEENRMYDAMYEAERLKKEQRHLDDVRRQQEGAGEVKRSLDAQVAAVRDRQAAEAHLEAQEVQRMQQHWAQLQAEAEAADRAERARLQRLAEEVKQWNALRLMELSEKEREEREQDLAILQEALAREAAEEAADAAAREAKRQAVLHYRQQLALMMAKEEADREEQDAMILASQRLQEAKQDAEWAAREEARRRLMAEVDAIRQQQIAAKAHAKQYEKQQQKLELQQVQGDLQSLEHEKAVHAAEARKRALKQQLDVQTQMMAHMHLKNAEKEEKLHAAQLAVQSEQRYMQRVTAAEQQVAPQAFYGRKKVEWFH
ncbi:hypothetical protein OEZ85_008556 [Tetradesmus obliquus]|uniref:Cilia- and flagella-associated protein 53 n=1 Tax=Tetradesmus obliquus TaxID=3088 RepID=A0ABY8TJD8_TETOB|nr:hypothetical protein OEZ85_008556 [Tetradesmus obliquus]